MDILKLIAVLVGLTLLVVGASWLVQTTTESSCVSVLKINGPIGLDEAPGQTSSRDVVQALSDFQDGSSKAVLVEINSPGGSAVASSEIYDALRSLKDANKTSVAYISEIGASGGYYSASGTQYIVANPNAITGSIGAVSDVVNYADLLQKLGIQQYAIKSGALKDIGAGYRNMTAEERALLQGLIDETAKRFQNDVRTARQGKLTARFNQLLDARIASAQTALDAGLIDQIGSRKDALKKAAQMAGLDTDKPSECDITPSAPAVSDLLSSIGFSMAQGFARGLESRNIHAQT